MNLHNNNGPRALTFHLWGIIDINIIKNINLET